MKRGGGEGEEGQRGTGHSEWLVWLLKELEKRIKRTQLRRRLRAACVIVSVGFIGEQMGFEEF